MRKLTVSVVLLFLPTIAFAETWVCTSGEGQFTAVFREVDGKYEEETRANQTNENLSKRTHEVFKETTELLVLAYYSADPGYEAVVVSIINKSTGDFANHSVGASFSSARDEGDCVRI